MQRMLFPLTPLHGMQRGHCCPFPTFCKCVLNPDFLIYIKNAFSSVLGWTEGGDAVRREWQDLVRCGLVCISLPKFSLGSDA